MKYRWKYGGGFGFGATYICEQCGYKKSTIDGWVGNIKIFELPCSSCKKNS